MSEWYLSGLNGGNPLAFLAALGTLRSMSLAWPDSRVSMRWEVSDGAWRPCIKTSETIDRESLIPALHKQLQRMVNHPAFTFSNDLAIDAAKFREEAIHAQDQANDGDRYFADFLAAFACDGIVEKVAKKRKTETPDEKEKNKKTGQPRIQKTAFRFVSGQQRFIDFMKQLAKNTTEEHLRETLFSTWAYSDPEPSMRWDTVDDRRYALRWRDPTAPDDKIRTVRGANRLAVEALPLFPVMPVGKRLVTTCFTNLNGGGQCITWPIWEKSVSIDMVRSLLALKGLQQAEPQRENLRAIGVVEAYRSRRIQDAHGYGNFTPAVPV